MITRKRSLALFGAGLVLPSCAARPDGSVRIASTDFHSNTAFAEIYAAALEREGIHVWRQMNVGNSDSLRVGAERGDIDVYPGYGDSAAGRGVKRLNPAPARESQALATSHYTGEKFDLISMEACSQIAPKLRLAATTDFLGSGALRRLQEAYGGFRFAKVLECAPNTQCDYLNRDEADVAHVYNLEPQVGKDQLVVLADERHVWPQHQVAPFVRIAVIEKYPRLPAILNRISGFLNVYAMQAITMRAAFEGFTAREVAEDFVMRMLRHQSHLP